jgi:hypothetical protein
MVVFDVGEIHFFKVGIACSVTTDFALCTDDIEVPASTDVVGKAGIKLRAPRAWARYFSANESLL